MNTQSYYNVISIITVMVSYSNIVVSLKVTKLHHNAYLTQHRNLGYGCYGVR